MYVKIAVADIRKSVRKQVKSYESSSTSRVAVTESVESVGAIEPIETKLDTLQSPQPWKEFTTNDAAAEPKTGETKDMVIDKDVMISMSDFVRHMDENAKILTN